MKDTQNLTLASKCFCDAVTHDLLTVENNIDFALRSWDQQCFRTIHSNKSVIFESWCLYICSSIGSRFIEKLFWKNWFLFFKFIFDFRELKSVQTCMNISEPNYRILFSATGDNSYDYEQSLLFGDVRGVSRKIQWRKKDDVSASLHTLPATRWHLSFFFLLTRAIDFAEKEGLSIIYNSAYRD